MKNPKNLILHYVSGLCGSRKTHQMNLEAFRLASEDEKVIIVNKSLQKNKDDYHDLRKLNSEFRVKIIDTNHNNSGKSVSKYITEEIKNVNPNQGIVLIITHQSFWNVEYFHCKEQWTVFWDEADDIIFHYNDVFKIEHKKQFIYPLIDFNPEEAYPKIKVKDDQHENLVDFVRDKDAVYRKGLRDINQELLNCGEGRSDIYLHGVYLDTNRLVFTSLYNLSPFIGFKHVTFFSALFEDILMYKHWKQLRVRWVEDVKIKSKLRFTKHTKPIKVYCAYKDKKHSKSLLQKTILAKTLLDHFKEKVFGHLNGKKSLIMLNKNDTNSHGLELCPYNAQGLRSHENYTNLVYAGAYNKDPSFYRLIKGHLGYEDVESALHFYQIILRTSYRNPNCDKPISVYVPCLNLFNKIAYVFPNAEIESFGLEYLENAIEDNRKKKFTLDDECYENKKAVLIKIFGRWIYENDRSKINNELIFNGYKLIRVRVRDKHNNTSNKELWYLFPDSIDIYFKKKCWKIIDVDS